MTTTTEPPLAVPLTEPTSRLHAAANALATWDHASGSGDDIAGQPAILPDHWVGAREVWDALQPKIATTAELDALATGDVIVKHTRSGVWLWVRTASGSWWPLVTIGPVARDWYSSDRVLADHGAVRLLWTRR